MGKRKVLQCQADGKPMPPLVWLLIDTVFHNPRFFATVKEFSGDTGQLPPDPLASELIERLFGTGLVRSIYLEKDEIELGLKSFPFHNSQRMNIEEVFESRGVLVRWTILVHPNGIPVFLPR